MAMAWAKLPSTWVRNSFNAADFLEPYEDTSNEDESHLGLRGIKWKEHKSSGTAALILIVGLAVISNLKQRSGIKREGNVVFASYTELEDMTGLSRAMISKGLRILEQSGAIKTDKKGITNSYALLGIETNGGYCAAPQAHLLDGTSHLKRLRGVREMIRKPSSLHAMKLYILLLAFREIRSNTTRIGYDRIAAYTGMRREEISIAWQILLASQLAYLADDMEEPLKTGERNHNRYKIRGLTGM